MKDAAVDLLEIWHKVYDDCRSAGWGPFPSAEAANKAIKAVSEALGYEPPQA